ncbi:hypothetical protein LXD69_04820 [Flavobacterium sediminilitoris]|uniref:RHS repeat-associated protein n=1 Tax=Flavobacterium sediminilitoris TaxID=2024526 RepID=A0ABY4HST4_9FLAO|nr:MULTISPECIES: RHS repeat-associated core domain-containing protein [Flavobacterium]UOX34834.1 hypothetical protein LXD69_04820 [Flavobacterium sediminilitoris]
MKLSNNIPSPITIITTYLLGFQYKNSRLEFFPHAEGYVKYDQGDYSYVFNYTDHLGNIRLSYTYINNSNIIDTDEIVEENQYYPFGLKHETHNSSNAYQYKFNGKELQTELGLNLYDYGARNYDPAIGRWMNMDNMSEKYFTSSPYVYAGNIPTKFVDYDGNDFGISFQNGVITVTQVWYNDGKSNTKDLLNKAIEYLNNQSGKYGVKTDNGDIIPINFKIQFSDKKDETYDDGIVNNHSKNQDLATNDDTANYLSAGGMELRNVYGANGLAFEGGDNTKFCESCTMYGDKKNYDADEGVVGHEIMHTLGMSHSAIGKNGTEMTKDGIGGMLLYASKNSKGFKVKLSNVGSNSYLGSPREKVSKHDKPKVVNSSPSRVKLSGTIVEIK